MKKIIIHIGYHKTGTSFLNRKFFPNHPKIHHLGKPYRDHKIAEIFERIIGVKEYDFEQCKALYDKYISPIREGKIVSITDGRIINHIVDGNLKNIPSRLLSVTNDASVIIVVRRQYDFLKSLYVQNLSAKNEKFFFNEWFDHNWEDGMCLKDQINYFDKIQAYIDIFGKENVKVFIYEGLLEDANRFTQDLCDFIGLDHTDFKEKNINNERVNQRITTLHRFIVMHPLLRYIVTIIKSIISDRMRDSIRRLIFKRFKRYDPELSTDRKDIVQKHAKTVNDKLIKKLNMDLHKYHYDI
jgi:hypothetical protein